MLTNSPKLFSSNSLLGLWLVSARLLLSTVASFFVLTAPCKAQNPTERVTIRVDAERIQGAMTPVWNYFGYDEPNYTYAPNGKKLLSELTALSPRPVYVRVHNLFTSGDGSASLKWGSTNVYTEEATGNPIYRWDIVDRIFDTFKETGTKPLVELGFMVEQITHDFAEGDASHCSAESHQPCYRTYNIGRKQVGRENHNQRGP